MDKDVFDFAIGAFQFTEITASEQFASNGKAAKSKDKKKFRRHILRLLWMDNILAFCEPVSQT
jgi:hypothetical protein